MVNEQKGSYKLKMLKISTITITSVFFVEVFIGLLVGSLAILSDGTHALLDSLTMLVLLITTSASLKPPDEEHMYGHEKFESIGGMVGGIALISIGILIMYESVLRLIQNVQINLGDFGFVGFIAIGYTFCVDFLRVGIFRKAIASESSTMKAGFYHAVADLGSTVIALLGFGLATMGFSNGDALASMILSILLIYLSVKLVWNCGMELSDAVARDDVKKIQSEIMKAETGCKCESLKVRKSGEKFFVEATLKVPDYISLEEAHEITARIEKNIRSAIGNVETTFHIEPAEIQELSAKNIEKLVKEVSGVKEAHEISMVYSKGKLYITLHARVDPKLSLREAHEIAEKIENKINERIKNIENLTVHIEPFDTEALKGSMVREDEIRKIVEETAENYPQTLRIKRIVTYVADKKRYINIDCCFNAQTSITEAHRIASKIEANINKRFVETIVTVHVEPDSK
ncbi:MAG: cation transporter [Candidatus Bathyarchaeota archaeon]|nr:MAG: cation transporter [Candidatus Bathyarchaeota archaeon]